MIHDLYNSIIQVLASDPLLQYSVVETNTLPEPRSRNHVESIKIRYDTFDLIVFEKESMKEITAINLIVFRECKIFFLLQQDWGGLA